MVGPQGLAPWHDGLKGRCATVTPWTGGARAGNRTPISALAGRRVGCCTTHAKKSGSPCGSRTRVCSLRKSHPAPRRTGHRETGRPNGICTRVPQVKTGDPELLDDEAMENDQEKPGPVIRLHPAGRTLIFSWRARALWEATRTVPRKRTHPSIPLDSGGVGLVRRRILRSWLIGTGLSGEAT